jgi:hypothetical protein
MSTTLRWSLMGFGCWGIVLLGAAPTDRGPSQPLPAQSPAKAEPALAEAAQNPSPASGAPPSVVKLSEAEMVDALSLMKQLGDNPLAGTLMDQPPLVGPSVAIDPTPEISPAQTPGSPIDLLREIAQQVDSMANQLEAEDLYTSADRLRTAADRLRHDARRIRQSEPRPNTPAPAFTRRPSRRFPRGNDLPTTQTPLFSDFR